MGEASGLFIKPPSSLNLDGNLSENWRLFQQEWELYKLATGISEKATKIQAATFLCIAGIDAQELSNTFTFGAGTSKENITNLVTKFEEYCNPKKNVTYERYKFNSVFQNGRNFETFLTELRQKSKTCEFGVINDSLIRDRVVIGIDSNSTRERLLRELDLPLEKASQICRANEQCKIQSKNLKSEANSDVNYVKSRNSKTKQKWNATPARSDNRQNNHCGNCGYNEHFNKAKCPALGATCRKCSKRNHFASVCRKGFKKSVDHVEMQYQSSESSETDEDISSLYISEIQRCFKNNAIISDLEINKVQVSWKVDTGSSVNIIGKNLFEKLDTDLLDTRRTLSAYGGKNIPVLGKCNANVTKNSKKCCSAQFFVVDIDDAQPLLGLNTIIDLKLINLNKSLKVCSITSKMNPDNSETHNAVSKNKQLDFNVTPNENLKINKSPVSQIKDPKHQIIEEYSDVFNGLGLVDGKYKICLDENAEPFIEPPRRVPLSLMSRLKDKLDSMIENGVVSRVNEPVDWCSNLVIIEKKDHSLRMCLDPAKLNNAIKRDICPPPSPEMVSSRLNGKKFFSVLDLSDCFWHKELTEESSLLCCFNTPFGRMKFNRLPFGISCASDVAQKMVNENFGDIENVTPVHDDLIIGGATQEEHDIALLKVLQRARERNIKFNFKKLQLCVDEVKYMGELVNKYGYAPDPSKITAISNLPRPSCKKGLQRFLGLVNFLCRYVPNMSKINAPLRELLRNDVPWQWHPEHDEAFSNVKEILTTAPVLKFFDISEPVTLQVDASLQGLGACLFQNDRPVAYASRSLTPAEKNYANIERELLGIVYGCERFHQYIYGLELTVETDHKPLESILSKPLSQAPPRLQKLQLRLSKYHPKVKWVPGRQMFVTDTLSRAPLETINEDPEITDDDDVDIMVHTILDNLPISKPKLDELKEINESDPVLKRISSFVKSGWPSKQSKLPINLRGFWNVRSDLHEVGGILMKDQRLVIPESWKFKMLKLLHSSHFGMEKTKKRAREILYWPNITKDIETMISKCSVCLKHCNKNAKEPMKLRQLPSRPWQFIASDIFEFQGNSYLVVIDYYSKYIEASLLKNKTSRKVIKKLKSIFSRNGIPDALFSDNMPYNSYEMRMFAIEQGFQIVTSSPRYPQSNGLAESAVGEVKKWLVKGLDLNDCLLEYRNTPVSSLQYSPSQLLNSRLCKTKLPVNPSLLKPCVPKNVLRLLEESQLRQKHYYDKGASKKEFSNLEANQAIQIRKPNNKSWSPAVVMEPHSAPRSYNVQVADGSTYRRNRRDIIATNIQPIIPSIPYDEMISSSGILHNSSNDQTVDDDLVDHQHVQVAEPRRSGRISKKPVRYGIDD